MPGKALPQAFCQREREREEEEEKKGDTEWRKEERGDWREERKRETVGEKGREGERPRVRGESHSGRQSHFEYCEVTNHMILSLQ